jgi:hypothetical protein
VAILGAVDMLLIPSHDTWFLVTVLSPFLNLSAWQRRLGALPLPNCLI